MICSWILRFFREILDRIEIPTIVDREDLARLARTLREADEKPSS